jgi:L-asparagine transporter-like permease
LPTIRKFLGKKRDYLSRDDTIKLTALLHTDSPIVREAGLRRALTRPQMTMIGIGSAIGTGLFMGSGIAIGYAGPAVLLSYLIAAVIVVIMVFSLSEMAVAHPTAGSFGAYAEMYLNPWAGFVVRYTYWMAQVIAIGGEAVAAGIYMTYWFPDIPVWWWSVGFAFALVYINTRSVANFGEFEYWFALIKVVAIVFFIIVGAALILGIGAEPIGFDNLTRLPGGFMPHGIAGVWMAVIMAVFSFYGIEVIAVTSGEARDPSEAIPAALRSMALRLFLFYVLGLTVMVSFIPWTEIGARVVTESPFVKVFDHAGIAYAAGIMNFVVLTAALSSMNTNVYLTSRMLFSLARGRFAPRVLGRLGVSGTPFAATLVSGVCILAVASVSRLTPLAYNYLFGIALFGGITVWLFILVSHLRFRRQWRGASLPVRMPLYPYVQILGIALLAAVLITMGLDTEFWNISWIVGVPWLVFISIAYLIAARREPPR